LKKLIPQSHIKIEDEGAFSVTNEMGYIMWFKFPDPEKSGLRSAWESPTIIVRPWLHAPEIDSYDEISLDKVIWAYGEGGELDLGVKIEYEK
jgi:hypothetical protein